MHVATVWWMGYFAGFFAGATVVAVVWMFYAWETNQPVMWHLAIGLLSGFTIFVAVLLLAANLLSQ